MVGNANRNGNLEKGSPFFLLCPYDAWTALRDLPFLKKYEMEDFLMFNKLKDEYSSEAEIKEAITEYNKDKSPEDEMRYCSYFNSIKRKRMHVPCTIEYFYAWRNMLAEEHRQRDNESRCLVPSERYSYMKRCQEDCNNCPFSKTHRDGKLLSLDRFMEDNNYEIADTYTETPHEAFIRTEREEILKRELSKLDEESQKILKLFNDGYTDEQIAKAMGLKRSTVQYKKSSLIKMLREKIVYEF